MTEATIPDHGAVMSATSGFSPAEIETFHSEDRSAGTAIVGLMVGIFTLGLIGYLLVCAWIG
jgi:hypothetical protein